METHPSFWNQSTLPTFNLLKRFRSSQSTSTSKAITSGTLARIRLILTNVWPPSVQIAAIHFVTCTLSALRFCRVHDLSFNFSFWWHDHSCFTIGLTTYSQSCGASMGSQWASIFCVSVASMREQTFLSCFHQVRANQIFHHRHIDNRDTFACTALEF